MQVRATTSAGGAGWSQSASSKIGKVGSYVDEKLRGQASTDRSSEIVKYKGTAVLMKKLKLLDLTDRVADAQDDASEILRGKKVTVQLMSNEIDQSMSDATLCQPKLVKLMRLWSYMWSHTGK